MLKKGSSLNAAELQYFEDRYAEMPPAILTKAVAYFRSVDQDWPKERFQHLHDDEIATAIAEHGQRGAAGMQSHMSWGRELRNDLRSASPRWWTPIDIIVD